MKYKIKTNKIIGFITIIFVFVIVPAFIISYSVYRYFKAEENQIILSLKGDSDRLLTELRQNIISEKYFCRLFHEFTLSEINNKNSNIDHCVAFCKKLKIFFGDSIDFIILENNGVIKYNSNADKYRFSSKEWCEALTYSKFFINNTYQNNTKIPDDESAKKIFGSRLVDKSFYNLFKENDYRLIRADGSEKIPPSAVYSLKWGGFFVFISKNLLNDTVHLKYNILDYLSNERIIAGLYGNDNIEKVFWSNSSINDIDKIKEQLKSHAELGRYFLENDNYYICNQYLTKNIRVFTLAERSYTCFNILFKTLIVFILYILLSTPIIRYFWNTIVLEVSGNASIRLKLAFLFLFASGIPLLSLAVISFEYRQNKRLTMIEDAKSWAVNKFLEIEQRYMSFLKKIRIELDEYVDKRSTDLKKEGLTSSYVQSFNDKLKEYDAWDFFFIASDSSTIGTVDGVIKYNGSLDAIVFDRSNSILFREVSDFRFYELKVLNIMLKKVCSDLNNITLSANIIKKLEIFAEGVLQKTFPEILYSLVETKDSIKEFGFGSNSNMSYIKFISVFDKKIVDYILTVTWLHEGIQKKFVNQIISEVNRNPRNFKLIAYEINTRETFPNSFSGNNKLERFARRASDKPTEDLEIININGENYIAVSMLGRNLFEFSFVGLYPIRNIDRVINYKSYVLLLLGFFCLLLAISLAQLLTKSFIKPMFNLQEGALAIETRNFDHRIPNLNTDEFGEVGNIFNNVMVGLKELEVARIVQESLFPKPDFKQGKFSIYGKSITMIDVGGDYLDFFKINDNCFSILLGDVAGHGLGAALIMSMAKAAILSGNFDLKSPANVLNNLHKMILATKSAKQRKIMTFQYLIVNSETGENLYGNAGACSPMLVRRSASSIEEVKMGGAALGAFKRAVYHEMSLDIQTGDALIFYTDGIVECKNKNGEMLGYEGLKKILLDCWAENPETYYNNIYKAYLDYVGVDAEAGDDLTIVVLMCATEP